MTMLLFLACSTGSVAAYLDPGVLQKVQAATFEVVIPKPVTDPLTYEKPLPLDLLPYQFRNDKYLSIGTAFALGGKRYVTAAHVMNIGMGGLLGAPVLRDTGGHVYAIDKIIQFSLG
jgi:serine protease Do